MTANNCHRHFQPVTLASSIWVVALPSLASSMRVVAFSSLTYSMRVVALFSLGAQARSSGASVASVPAVVARGVL